MHKRSCKKKKSGGRKLKKKKLQKFPQTQKHAFADQKGPLSVQHNGGK